MKDFRFNAQTAMFFGHDCIKKNSSFFKKYGSRAVIFTSQFPVGHINMGLEDVKSAFESEEIEYYVIDRVSTDPPVESVMELSKEARSFNADFFIAVGGGSAIDTAKAAAFLAQLPEDADPYEVFWGDKEPPDSIRTEVEMPVFTVPTTAGTGAETTPFAVLTRSDIHTKRMMYHYAYPYAAFLDSRYIVGSPDFLLAGGVLDALCHGIETYVHRDATPMGRMLAEYGFELFSEFKDALTDRQPNEDDYDKMQLAAFVQGMTCMQSSTTLPHGLGYPLSHQKHVAHGLACAVFMGEYLRSFKDKSQVEKIACLCGFDSVESFAEFCDDISQKHINIEVSDEEILAWTENFMQTQTVRIETNPEPVSKQDIERFYRSSLGKFLVK